ncbi:MAG: hypothetical protein LLF76_01365 [Planctomycetaceae bacterium]|nr:hypothetical protein [Planctomycetaceae bacterium]
MAMRSDELQFSKLFGQIADSFGAAAVLFDTELHIVEVAGGAQRILVPETTIDTALSYAAQAAGITNWKEVIASVLHLNQRAILSKVRFAGMEHKLWDLVCLPVHDGDGGVIGGVIILYEVVEQKDAHYTAAHSERAAAVGHLASKVAHELNSPLDGILRYVNLSLRMLEQGQAEKATAYMQHCRSGLQRMAQIITETLEFSRSSHFAYESGPLDKLLEEALRSLDGPLKSIEVHTIRTEAGPLPHFKSGAMVQVFSNIIKNAADAMNGTGTLTITVGRGAGGWQIDFEDTGPGFGPHAAEELFRPFFTTKAPGRGTGLGLSICRDILEKFGGRISARNLAGGGACFSVHLPSASIPSPVRS